MPANLDELMLRAEGVFDTLNAHHRDMLRKAVFVMRRKARARMAVGGGLFKGRKV